MPRSTSTFIRCVPDDVQAGRVVPARIRSVREPEVGDQAQQLLHGDAHLEPREVGADAAVRPDPERHVPAVAAIEMEAVGVREHGRVAVRRTEQEQHALALGDRLAGDLGVARRRAAERGHGRVEAQRLLDEVVDEGRVGQHGRAMRGLDREVTERRADAEGRVLEARDEQEEAEVEDLVLAVGPALDVAAQEQRDQVVAARVGARGRRSARPGSRTARRRRRGSRLRSVPSTRP